MRDLNKFKGCLIGGAAGDALGYTVEFLPGSAILQRFGENGITEYQLRHGVAEISDDTQMTLFTAAGLLAGAARGVAPGTAGSYVQDIAGSYLDWYRAQTGRYPLSGVPSSSWLVTVPELFASRAPGMTCMSALARGGNGTLERPLNESCGCGGVMRVAPIGLYFIDTAVEQREIDLLGAKASVLTHGHELGYIPSAMLVHIVSRIAGQGDTIPAAVRDAMHTVPALFPQAVHLGELLELLQKAVALAGEGIDDRAAIRQLGEGWVAQETLAIAVYCALKYADDFEQGLIAAVNHSGDSDSTGAVTGNILGAALGFDAIPPKFTGRLELADVILEIAGDLYNDRPGAENRPRDIPRAGRYGLRRR